MSDYDPDRHHRRSIRLSSYDYRQHGVYYVTICTQQKSCLFGDIEGDEIRLNEAGVMIRSHWESLPERFHDVGLDAFVIMPNHMHGILVFVGCSLAVGPRELEGEGERGEGERGKGEHKVRPYGTVAGSLGRIIQAFKSLTTRAYVFGVRDREWEPFSGRLWQRNYYEHIIRDADSLDRIRSYVETNPARWAEDAENPERAAGSRPASPRQSL